MLAKIRIALVFPLVLVLAGGCAKSSTAGASVHGKVMYHDKPVTGGTVTFQSADGSFHYSGTIDKDGNYAARDIPAGELIVTVDTKGVQGGPTKAKKQEYGQQEGHKNSQGSAYEEQMKKRRAPIKETESTGTYVEIPARYSDAKQTPLKKEITKGDQKWDIVLTD